VAGGLSGDTNVQAVQNILEFFLDKPVSSFPKTQQHDIISIFRSICEKQKFNLEFNHSILVANNL